MPAPILSIALLTAALLSTTASAEDIGSVNTNFRITGSDKIVIEAFDDPLVGGVTCYVSRARTGGIKGTLGVAEDVSEASVACGRSARSASSSRCRSRTTCSRSACR